MALDPTVSPANQAFPAVLSAPSSFPFATPNQVTVANTPVAHPSDVIFTPLADIPSFNISNTSFNDPKAVDYLVMPGLVSSIATGSSFSPIVLQIIAWPAANMVQVVRATRGVIIPPLNENLLPGGYLSATEGVDLLRLGTPLLGRKILPVDRPTFLEFEPFNDLTSSPPVPIYPTTTVFADTFSEVIGAVITGIQAPDILILSKSFTSNPATSQAWIIIDERPGFEVQTTDYNFQGDYTPESFPIFASTNAPFLGDAGTATPQSFAPTLPPSPAQSGPLSTNSTPASAAPEFNSNPPQAVPPVLITVNPADATGPGRFTQYFP